MTETKVYHLIARLLSPYRLLLALLCLVAVFVTISEGAGLGLILPLLQTSPATDFWPEAPLFVTDIMTQMNQMQLVSRVRLAALFLLVIALFRNGFQYLTQLLSLKLQLTVERSLQTAVIKQLHQVNLSYIHRYPQGHFLEIYAQHVRFVSMMIFQLGMATLHLATIILYTALMIIVSWQLTVIALLLLTAVYFFTRRPLNRRIRQSAVLRRNLGLRINALAVETISAMRLIHLFNQEATNRKRLEEALKRYFRHNFQASRYVAMNRPLFSLVNIVALCLLIIAATYALPVRSDDWVERLILFLVIAFRLMPPATALNQLRATVVNTTPALESIFSFLNREDKPYLVNGSIPFIRLENAVTLKNVQFGYEAGQASVLHNVSFTIPRGEITAVVGPSGAGKSTIVNLLTRLYDVDSGEICIDGEDLRLFDIASWRSQIAVVSQDTFVFNDTVLANLKFAKEAATIAEIEEAARLAQAHGFINELPQGYDTMLGDRGVRLSGGQRQRIAIARALLVDPQLIIFDEATSELDSQTERAFQEALAAYGRNRTVFVIAHRLSTVRHAHNIVVMAAGEVVEQGTHATLMAHGKTYRRLIEAQNFEQVSTT